MKTGRDLAEDLFIFGVLKYVDIARSGHIRQVLKHLADEAALHIRQQGSSRIRKERDANAGQSSAALHVILTAFFLVTSCSLSAVDINVVATYHPSGHLHEHPICPDNKGRDILLAGILTTSEPLWRNHAATLEDAYVQFLVQVGQQVLTWSTDRGATRLVAIGTYKRKLTLWLTDRRLPHPHFKDLAQRVLKELSKIR